MPFAFFWISARHGRSAQDELNDWLKRYRILSVQKELRGAPGDEGWAVAVEYLDAAAAGSRPGAIQSEPGRIDYRQILPPEIFRVFAALRVVRKGIAAEEGVPPFQIATNEHLAEIARRGFTQRAELEGMVGFGPARGSKYGDRLLAAAREARVSGGSEGAEAAGNTDHA